MAIEHTILKVVCDDIGNTIYRHIKDNDIKSNFFKWEKDCENTIKEIIDSGYTDKKLNDFLNKDTLLQVGWKELPVSKRKSIFKIINEKIVQDLEYNQHIEKTQPLISGQGLEVVYLYANDNHAVYTNGIYDHSMSKMEKKSLIRIEEFMTLPARQKVTIQDNDSLNKYCEENKDFPKYLKDLISLIDLKLDLECLKLPEELFIDNKKDDSKLKTKKKM